MTADSTTVEIVNTNQVEEQRLVVQGGAYGEHKIVSAATDGGGAQSRSGGSPRTVDSLLRKHVQSDRIARVRRGLYVSVPPGGDAATVDAYLVATKAVEDAVQPLKQS